MRAFYAFAVACLLLIAAPALAQEPTTTTQTIVNVGDIIGSVASALLLALAVPIAGLIVNAGFKFLQGMGVAVTDSRKAQLQELVVNGINYAASLSKEKLKGRMPVDVKSAIVKEAIDYVLLHGNDLLKLLGVDPQSAEARSGIEARVERALNDPTSPTPPEVTPDVGKPASVTVVAPAAP